MVVVVEEEEDKVADGGGTFDNGEDPSAAAFKNALPLVGGVTARRVSSPNDDGCSERNTDAAPNTCCIGAAVSCILLHRVHCLRLLFESSFCAEHCSQRHDKLHAL